MTEKMFDVAKLHYKMEPDETPLRTWGWHEINWGNTIYLCLVHIGGMYGLYLWFTFQVSLRTYLIALFWFILGGLGITAGAHRYYTHRSYEATLPLQLFLAFCNCIANQGSVWRWSRDHVVHHKYSESVADPHDARRGFFFSHVGWLLVLKQPEIREVGKRFNFDWLKNDPIVRFQHAYYFPLIAFFSFLLPGFICSYWGEFWQGLWFSGFSRYIYCLHVTWCVNSVAHLQGDRPYDSDISPSESLFTSIVAMGEGWHNYHHTYPRDYATSEFGVLQRYNPTKLFLDFCGLVGLAKNFHRDSIKGKETRLANSLKREL